MARWSARNVALCLAGASVLVGCFLGGQTGDPGDSVGTCDQQNVPPSETTIAEFAQIFAGSYTSTLRWIGGNVTTAGAPVPDDQITITLTYHGAVGTVLCGNLSVPVAIEITTRDSGIHETGTVTLSQDNSEFASFGFSGQQVNVSGLLNRSNGTVSISGSLESLVADLPGLSAQFPAPATNTGTGSGGTGGAP
jgi:hypothetical protein